MPLSSPILDNRTFQQLRDELVRRIPVYTPEWTDHHPSDPGVTLIELFAFLGENLLYRFNQIPETTQLEFLRLLQIPLRPAQSSRALVTFSTEQPEGVLVPLDSKLTAGKLPFETQTEVRVLPISLRGVCKSQRALPDAEAEPEVFEFFQRSLDALDGLEESQQPVSYQNEVLSTEGELPPADFERAVDGMLWIAVLANPKQDPTALRQELLQHDDAPLLINVGFLPEDAVPDTESVDACPGPGASASSSEVVWQISTGRFAADSAPIYKTLVIGGDTTRGLAQAGVVRIELPREEESAGMFDLLDADLAGSGDLPPVLDDETEPRILFWLRAFRRDQSRFGRVQFVGANAAQVHQGQAARPEFLGTGNGQADQSYRLVHAPVLANSLVLQVETPEGWQTWSEVDGLHASSEDDTHYVLDRALGEIRFGNGLQGAAPQIGQRIRAREYRYGGGQAGNVPAGAISKTGIAQLKVTNPQRAYGGADAESVTAALERIPGELRRRDRAVTSGDFRELAVATPGADLVRAECLPRYLPRSRMSPAAEEVPGVVSVVVWPRFDAQHPNAPRPNRRILRLVCEWLDRRRLITTELYVIPPTYRPIAISVGVQVKPGYGIDAVRSWVELVIRQYLAPVAPYGPDGQGWPLGRRVHGPELQAAALQVEGVEFLHGLEVAGWHDEQWHLGTVQLERDEVPEVMEITVVEGPPEPVTQPLQPPESTQTPVPIPVLREEC